MKMIELDPIRGFKGCELGTRRENIDLELIQIFKANLLFDDKNMLRAIIGVRSGNIFIKKYKIKLGDNISKIPLNIYNKKNLDISINEKFTSGKKDEQFVSFADNDNIYFSIDNHNIIKSFSLIDNSLISE